MHGEYGFEGSDKVLKRITGKGISLECVQPFLDNTYPIVSNANTIQYGLLTHS